MRYLVFLVLVTFTLFVLAGVILAPLVPWLLVKSGTLLHWWMVTWLAAFPVVPSMSAVPPPPPASVTQNIEKQIIYAAAPGGCRDREAPVVQPEKKFYVPELL